MTDTHPHRVQLSRRKGWRMPAGAVNAHNPPVTGSMDRCILPDAKLDDLIIDRRKIMNRCIRRMRQTQGKN